MATPYGCSWIIGMGPTVRCGKPATHYPEIRPEDCYCTEHTQYTISKFKAVMLPLNQVIEIPIVRRRWMKEADLHGRLDERDTY